MALEYFRCPYFALLKQDVVPSQTKGIIFPGLRKFEVTNYQRECQFFITGICEVTRASEQLFHGNELLGAIIFGRFMPIINFL